LKEVNGIWLPDHEAHLLHYAENGKKGEWTYQANKLLKALEYVKNTRVAIDVGGHCGLWSKELVKVFDKVIAFEPVAEHRECFIRNVRGDYELHPVALGDKLGLVSMHTTSGQSGDTWIEGDGDIPVTLLDEYNIQGVDFIKLDCEGYELFALKGGEQMLKREHPVIIVEQKPGRGKKFGLNDTAAVTYLESLGYKLQKEMAGDYILT
jgi:FkbM family methyltransferase